MNEIKLILDKEINLLENDLLGTKTYVEVLKQITKDCKTPYTIGVFGSWGSGKSSIIRTLKEVLSNEKGIKFFVYDAWKYSRDDFRRTFILELRRFLGLDITQENELFYKDKVEEIKFKPKIDLYAVGLFLFALILTLIFARFLFSNDWLKSIIGSLSFSTLLTIVFTFFRNSLIYQRVAITTSKVFAPEKFEERFKQTIGYLIKKKGFDRVIIAIDNIDRCYKEQVLEILQTIKTFMEIEKVIFLIPIDDAGLRKFLGMSHTDADEFLRKIFNTSIKIKSFSESELYDYGIELLNKHQIDLPEKEIVISLICQEFTKNPRKVIQILNILQSEYKLAHLQESQGLIPKGAITSNIEVLVKLLIIREHYPDIYEKVLDNKNLLQEIHKAIKENKFEMDAEGNWIYKDFNIKLNENEYRFFMRTSNIEISPDKLELFLVNKDTFKEIPDEFYSYIISQDWSKIQDLMAKQNIGIDKILKLIDYITDEDVIKRKLYKTTGYNLLSLLFKIIAEKKEKVEPLPQHLKAIFNINELWKEDYLLKYPLKEMCETAKYFYDKGNLSVCEYIIFFINNNVSNESIKNDKNNSVLINKFILSFKDKPEVLDKVKNKFSELLSKDFILYDDFKEVINSDIIKYLLTDNFANELIPSLQRDYLSNQTKEKVELVKKLYEYNVLSPDTIKNFVNRCIQNLGYLQNYQNFESFNFWLDAINSFISDKLDSESKQKIYQDITGNNNSILQNFNSNNLNPPYIQTYKQYITLLGNFYLICTDNNQKQNLISWLNQFFINHNREVYEHTIQVYHHVVDKSKDKNYPFANDIIQQLLSVGDASLKDELVKVIILMVEKTDENNGLSKEQTDQIVKNFFDEIFNKNNSKAEGWLKTIYDKSNVAQKSIQKYIQENISKINLGLILDLIIKIPFDVYYKKVRELLARTDKEHQRKGIDTMYVLLQNNLLNEIDSEKKDRIRMLIDDLDIRNFDDTYRDKIDKLKSYFNLEKGR